MTLLPPMELYNWQKRKIPKCSNKVIRVISVEFKSLKHVKLCQGPEEIYSVGHTILSESAIVYEINPLRTLVIDPNDYLTHEIYFTNSENEAKVYSCLG